MTMLFGAMDETGNILGRPPAPMETACDDVASDEDGAFPRSKLYDRETSEIFLTSADPQVNFRIRQDTNLLADCEVNGTGTTLEANGIGTLIGNGAWIADDEDDQIKHQDVQVDPAALFRFEATGVGRIPSGDGAGMAIRNLDNGQWLVKTDSTLDHTLAGSPSFDVSHSSAAQSQWQDADPGHYGLWNFSGDAPQSYTVDFQVGDLAACKGQRKVTLRVYLYASPPGESSQTVMDAFLRVQLIPALNGAVISNHNIAGAVTAVLQASGGYVAGSLWRELDDPGDPSTWGRAMLAIADDFRWADLAPMAIDQPAFYCAIAQPVFPRYLRIYFPGTMLTQAWIGEAYAGHLLTMLHPQERGWSDLTKWPQVRQTNDAGVVRRFLITRERQKGLNLTFRRYSTAQLHQLADELYNRTQGGVWPAVIVADDQEPEVVMGFFLEDQLDAMREFDEISQARLTVVGLTAPVVGK